MKNIILDSGCSSNMVHKDLVPQGKMLEEEAVKIQCAHSDVTWYPLASVKMEVNGIDIQVKAAVSGIFIVSVLLGRDLPQLNSLL